MARVYQDPRSPTRAGRRPWFIDYVDFGGRRRRERTPATTKMEADAILRGKLSELAKARITGAPSIQSVTPMTFAEFVRNEYLPHSQVAKRATTHARNVQLARTLQPFFGSLLLHAITAGDMRRYMDRRLHGKTYRGTTPRPATVNKERDFVSAVLTEARLRGYVQSNCIHDVKKLPEDNARDRWLTVDEESRLLDAAAEWLKPLIQFGLQTGMRRGEILSSKWSDVDRQNGFIRVPHAKNHRTRYVPIGPTLDALLDTIRPHTSAKGFSPFVFVNGETEEPYRGSSVSHAFEVAARKARLDGVTFHTLRHTCVSRLVQAGKPDRKIRMMIGHSSTHMTDRYAHLAPNDLRDLGEALAGGAERKPTSQVGTK